MTVFIYQVILVIASIGLYIPTQLWCFGTLKWSKDSKPGGFWGAFSDHRKYKGSNKMRGPAFPGSTGPLVFLTDGYHLFQFLSWRCIYGAVALGTPYPLWVFVGMFFGMPFFFWLSQELFSKDA
jgi:hypothetical protein